MFFSPIRPAPQMILQVFQAFAHHWHVANDTETIAVNLHENLDDDLVDFKHFCGKQSWDFWTKVK